VEVPAYGLSYVGMQRAGRRPVMAASLIVGGAAILVRDELYKNSSSRKTDSQYRAGHPICSLGFEVNVLGSSSG